MENHGAYTFWDSVAPSIEQLNNTSYMEVKAFIEGVQIDI